MISEQPRITFVVPVNDRGLFENNFLQSPCIQAPHEHQVLVQENFRSAATAYNDAIAKSVNDLIVFCHQDVLLPQTWMGRLRQTLEYLEANDPRWGVLGSCGMNADDRKWKIWGQVYSPGLGIVGEPLEHPVPVQTLDGLLLILRKSTGLRFNERLPHFHFYGTDICLTAKKEGKNSYAIPAFCIHNAQHYLIFPQEYYECYRHVRRVWKEYLPIQTTCVRFTRFNLPMYKRLLVEAYIRRFGSKHTGATRVPDGREVLLELEARTQDKRDAL